MKTPQVESIVTTSSLPATQEQVQDMEPITVEVEQIPINMEQVRKYIAPTGTQQELFMFMGTARTYGLNPFKREIHFIKYGNKDASFVVGFEVYLKRAERSGKLKWWGVEIEKDSFGEKAVCTIIRSDWEKPFVWEAYREEFDKKQSTWNVMPYFMLKKVAIGQAFRLAFPDELGGMPYVREELPYAPNNGQMVQHVDDIPAIESVEKVRNVRADQESYFGRANLVFKNDDERHRWQKEFIGKESTETWENDDYDLANELLNDMIDTVNAQADADAGTEESGNGEPDTDNTVGIEEFQVGEIKDLLPKTDLGKTLKTQKFRNWWTTLLKVEPNTDIESLTFDQGETILKALRLLAAPEGDDGQDDLTF
jgi:phage recombination protein Bet